MSQKGASLLLRGAGRASSTRFTQSKRCVPSCSSSSSSQTRVSSVRSNSSAANTRAQFNTPSPTPGQSITQTAAKAATSAAADPTVRSAVLDAASKAATGSSSSSSSSNNSATANITNSVNSSGHNIPASSATESSSPSSTDSETVRNAGGGAVPPPPPGASPKKKRGFFGKLKLVLGYGSLALLGSAAYYVYDSNHPPEQLPFDPTKKTVVILGSGWGATALIDALDTTDYNVVVISPYNYFLFTPLLPSVTVGTLNGRSILQPTRQVVRYKSREVQVLEAEATKVDPKNKTVTFEDQSDMFGNMGTVQVPYDYLVYAVGSENQTFGIEGVKKHGLFLKELNDAETIRRRLMDCVEKASLLGQSEEEIDRLLHFVVVGGGPTGVEASGEFRDFVRDDLSKWYPAVSGRVKVSLIEALPNILPSFSKNLVEFTEHVFKENEIQILTKHMVKDVDEKSVTVQDPNGKIVNIPCGMLVWAAGNTARPITRDLQSQLSAEQTQRRGLLTDELLRLKGAEESIFAIGDATATDCPPTAQVANQQGKYLATLLETYARLERVQTKLAKVRKEPASPEQEAEQRRLEKKLERTKAAVKPFHYTNRGAMAYIGTEKAIADLPYGSHQLSSGGFLTSLAWSSAYWSMLFGVRSRASVALDWLHVRVFGRSIESHRLSTNSSRSQ